MSALKISLLLINIAILALTFYTRGLQGFQFFTNQSHVFVILANILSINYTDTFFKRFIIEFVWVAQWIVILVYWILMHANFVDVIYSDFIPLYLQDATYYWTILVHLVPFITVFVILMTTPVSFVRQDLAYMFAFAMTFLSYNFVMTVFVLDKPLYAEISWRDTFSYVLAVSIFSLLAITHELGVRLTQSNSKSKTL